LTKRQRFELGLAAIGASATLAAGLIPPAVEGSSQDAPVSCSAAVERVIDIAEDDPRVAHLYASGDPRLLSLFSEEEEEACGPPLYLLKQLDRESEGRSQSGAEPKP
jgi:hypothetical protein